MASMGCWELLLCPVASIIAIHFCIVSPTLTSHGFRHVQNRLACLVIKSPSFTDSLPWLRSHQWLPVEFRILFKINFLTCIALREKSPVHLHSVLAISLPSHSLGSNNGTSLSVPRVKTITGAKAFHSCAPSL